MTDRLSALLHEEAERLHVPMPTAHETITRRATHPAAPPADAARVPLVAAVAVLGVGSRLRRRQRATDRCRPRPRPLTDGRRVDLTADLGVVFAVDDTVYLDGGSGDGDGCPRSRRRSTTPRPACSSAPTRTGASDGGAPFHFAAGRRPTGPSQPLDLTLGEVVPVHRSDASPTWRTPRPTSGDGPGRRRRRHDRRSRWPGWPCTGLTDWGGWDRTAGRPRRRRPSSSPTPGTPSLVDWRTGEVEPAEHVSPAGTADGGGRPHHRATSDTSAEVVDARLGRRCSCSRAAGGCGSRPTAGYAVAGEGAMPDVTGAWTSTPWTAAHAVVEERLVHLRLDRRRPASTASSRTASSRCAHRRAARCHHAAAARTGCRLDAFCPAARLHLRKLRKLSSILSILSISGRHRRRTW